jgi:hypothetical protein
MSRQLDILLSSYEIEPYEAEDEQILGLWDAAVGSYEDSLRVRRVNNRVAMCYQAGLQAASALVATAGYRVRMSNRNHHATTFSTLAALELGELSELARGLNLLRTQRHRSVYSPEPSNESIAADRIGELDRIVRAMLAAGRAWIGTARPVLRVLPRGASIDALNRLASAKP